MSIDAMRWAWRVRDLPSSGCHFVLVTLADFADESGSCFPSVETLAERTTQGYSTVRRHLQTLADLGYVTTERRRFKDGSLGGLRFQIHSRPCVSPSIPNVPERSPPPLKSSHGEKPPATAQNEHQPPLDLSGQEDPPTELTPNSSLRSLTREAAFAEFWLAYPWKVGKPNAMAAYKRSLKLASLEDILAGLGRAKAEWERDPKLLPHPTTWLNRQGWTDEAKPILERTTDEPAYSAKFLARQANFERSSRAAKILDEALRQRNGG